MAKQRKPKLPTRIPVLGVPFDIEWGVVLPDDEFGGTTLVPDHLIQIGGRNDTANKRASTLLHEITHAALGVAGLADVIDNEKLEEAIVVCLEHALLPLLQTVLDVSNLTALDAKGIEVPHDP